MQAAAASPLGLGTVLGALAGGIAGAMGGSAVASHVRQAPLREAEAATQVALETYAARVEEEQRRAADAVADAERHARTAVRRHERLLEQQVAADVRRLEEELARVTEFDARQVLERSFAELERRCLELPVDLVQRDGTVPDVHLQHALHRKVRELRARAARLASIASHGDNRSEEFWDIVACSTEGDRQLCDYVARRVDAQRRAHARCVEHVVVQAAALDGVRAAAGREVRRSAVRARDSAVCALHGPGRELQSCHSQYVKELRAAGHC